MDTVVVSIQAWSMSSSESWLTFVNLSFFYRLSFSQAGAIAASVVDLCVYPLDTLKTRLQLKPQQLAQSFPQNRGLYSGLYQGVGSVVVATLPAAGLSFCLSPFHLFMFCLFDLYNSILSLSSLKKPNSNISFPRKLDHRKLTWESASRWR